MKKFLFLFIATLALISCEDTQTNEVALQAKVNNRLYISKDARASQNEDGSVTIQGFTQDESLTLHLRSLREGNFAIGEGRPNYAIFEDMGGNLYTTVPDGEGQVTISDLNEVNKTLSGTFKFSAMLPGIDTIYVSRGVIFDVSYAGSGIEDPTNTDTFSADVNGNPFIPITIAARDTGNRIAITGSTSSTSISLTLSRNIEVGQYIVPQGGSIVYRDNSGTQPTEDGIIKITAHNTTDKTISGTFSFNTTESTSITNGKFSVSYN